jgi:hypothetical protein
MGQVGQLGCCLSLAALLVRTLSPCRRMAEKERKYVKNEKCVVVEKCRKKILLKGKSR